MFDSLKPDVHVSLIRALAGGAIAAGIMSALLLLVGQVGAWKAEVLLDATLPTTRFVCSSVMKVSATILALMLTVIGISRGAERPIQASFYRRIQQIALLDVIAFVASTILLLGLVVPFGEDLEMPQGWYVTIYYVVTIGSTLVGGLLIAVVLMLYGAVHDVVMLFWSDESPVLDEDAERRSQPGDSSAEDGGDEAGGDTSIGDEDRSEPA